MRYRNLWSCLVLFTLLSTLGTLILAEDLPSFEAFVQAHQDYSIPKDDKDDVLYQLRVESCNLDTNTMVVIGNGSAINLGDDDLLTCSHCVDFGIPVEFFIRGPDSWMECVRVASDEELDVALLHCKCHIPAPPIKLDSKAQTDGSAFVYGSPWGGPKQRYEAKLKPNKTRGIAQGPQLTCRQVCQGCSGGPVVFDHKVIGMLQAIKMKAGGVHSGDVYYVGSQSIMEWLKEAREALEKKDGNKGPVKP